MQLLKKLCSIGGTSGDEGEINEFLLNYIKSNSKSWKKVPKIYYGKGFQDCIILVFGEPRCAIYAHLDVIGFTVAYNKELIKIGGPKIIDGIKLTGKDSSGKINCELMVIDKEDGSQRLEYLFNREIDRGTPLTYKQKWIETDDFFQSCYLDNRLGIWSALKVAETLQDGAICFTCYEEHGGGTAGYCAKFLFEKYALTKALICDITGVSDGIHHGKGVVLSLRDSGIARRKFVNEILALAKKSRITFQLEVESLGGSDGTAIQKSNTPVDWMFIGAPINNIHTPYEISNKRDILTMVKMYNYLMKNIR